MYAEVMYVFRAATIIYLEGLEIQSSCLPDSYPLFDFRFYSYVVARYVTAIEQLT